MEQEQIQEAYSLQEIFKNIKLFLIYLKSKWGWFLLAGLFGAGIGFVYYYQQKPKYEGTCTFILEEKNSSGGGLAGLASQFGVDIGSMSGGGGIFAGDNILEIIPSKNIVNKILLAKVDANKSATFADLYLDFSGLKKAWAGKSYLSNINFYNNSITGLNLLQDSILYVIYRNIIKKNLVVERTSKKGSIIRVTVSSPNEFFSKYMSDNLVLEAVNLYINIKTNTSQGNIATLQKRADSLLYLLNAKTYNAASSQILNANAALKTVIVPIEIQARDKTVIGTIYTEVIRNLETSKMILAQQTPIVQILDKSSFPLEDNKKGKFFLCIVGGIISGLICSFLLIIAYLRKFIN